MSRRGLAILGVGAFSILFLLMALVRRSGASGWLTLALLFSSRAWVDNLSSGLETPLIHLLLTLFPTALVGLQAAAPVLLGSLPFLAWSAFPLVYFGFSKLSRMSVQQREPLQRAGMVHLLPQGLPEPFLRFLPQAQMGVDPAQMLKAVGGPRSGCRVSREMRRNPTLSSR